eukprot:TRINITY_DN34988_c0_g1_i1.p3 TRINITY_DN34988_c0_g1~~TRINITY_DN34988_c0_g1_i1.p3  ORF type:complete len:125 (-),score=4.09 TRINITY_DN34988_c0_g1_i1:79-453(-)
MARHSKTPTGSHQVFSPNTRRGGGGREGTLFPFVGHDRGLPPPHPPEPSKFQQATGKVPSTAFIKTTPWHSAPAPRNNTAKGKARGGGQCSSAVGHKDTALCRVERREGKVWWKNPPPPLLTPL